MASSGVRNGGAGPRMSARPDRQGFGATPKAAAGKQRLSSVSAAAGAYRRTSSGPLPAAGAARASSDGGGCGSLWLRRRSVDRARGRDPDLDLVPRGLGGFEGFGAGLICIWLASLCLAVFLVPAAESHATSPGVFAL